MSNIIDKIQLSGVTYDIGGQGGSGVSVVEVTQAEYDVLPSSAKTDTSKMYVITDAEAGDLTNYYTKSETNTLLGDKADTATTYTKTEVDNAITAATATKQDTLVSGTNIKTINNTSILGSGNIDIQGGGGSITIDPSLDSGSTNPVANSAITQNFYNYAKFVGDASNGYGVNVYFNEGTGNYMGINLSKLKTTANGTSQTSTSSWCRISTINGKKAFSTNAANVSDFSLVETSAITTSVTSSSTDAQVPSAKAVYDQLGGLKLVKLTQSAYDALSPNYDSNTLYVIVN